MTTDLHRQLPEWPQPLASQIRSALVDSNRTIVVLDDDPTGTQTVHDVPVLTSFEENDIYRVVADGPSVFYLLTNSRALSATQSQELHRSLADRLKRVAQRTDRRLELISRSDSTLRGHFPLETDTIAATWPQQSDLTLVMPFFAEGGRLTIDGQHYVCDATGMIPAHETPFATDPVFGYRHSFLPDWIQEKTNGRVPSDAVVLVSLEAIRRGGPDRVAEILNQAPEQAVCVADSASDQDAYVVAMGVQFSHRNVMARTAASYVRARAGLQRQPLLAAKDLGGDGCGGLTVVGSHVPKSTQQLKMLRDGLPELVPIEIPASQIAHLRPDSPETNAFEKIVTELSATMNEHLTADRDVVLFTSRQLELGGSDRQNLEIANIISRCVSQIVGQVAAKPRYLIGKGGITSSDLATKSLHASTATVIGSILPGIPVWRLGQQARFPGLNYVVFPGNVGDDDALLSVVRKLRG